jgi:spermidine synthase
MASRRRWRTALDRRRRCRPRCRLRCRGHRLRLLTYLLFLLSGATALIYQVVWARSFSLIFGASHQAISIVLGAFMAGLALGSVVFGRRSRRVERPLRLYGVLELGIGAAALLVPLALRAVDGIYVGLAIAAGEVDTSLHVLRAALAFTVLVVPTFLMGGTLPLLVRFLAGRHGDFGVRLASLYGANTAGAVLGVLAGGFLLLPALGVWQTQLAAAALNFLVGVAAIAADLRLGRGAAAASPAGIEAAPAPAGTAPAAAAPGGGSGARPEVPLAVRLAYLGTAVSGLCALALEVMWTRSLSVTIGLSVYSFTVMLAAFLLGIALGSWLHAVLPLRSVPVPVQFGAAFVALGLTSAGVTYLIPHLPQLGLELGVGVFGGQGITVGTTLILSLAVMLVPCLFMGLAFPLAGEARAMIRGDYGDSVGSVLGLNTLGAILGALLAGFVIVPLLGLQRGLLLVSAAYAGYGLAVLAASLVRRLELPSWAAGVAAAGALVAGAVIVFLPRPWDRRILASFSHNSPAFYRTASGGIDVGATLEGVRIFYYREGQGSTVSVYDGGHGRVFQVNGHTEAGDALLDLHHQLLLGHVPALLHPRPRSAVVIGLGAGCSLGALAAYDSIEKLTVVEIEPAVRGVAEEFSDVNGGVLRDPRLRVVYQDGRNYLLTTPERFDVISADPLHPWTRGAAYLYTTEYYRLLADRLTEGGIACQWLGLYELTGENVKSILRTFAENFPHVMLWQCADDIILIGSRSPLAVDLERVAGALESPAVRRQLAGLGLADPLSFLAELSLGDDAVRGLFAGARLNTDDNLYIEFSSPLSTAAYDAAISAAIAAGQSIPAGLVRNFSPRFGAESEMAGVLEAYSWAKRQTLQATVDVQRPDAPPVPPIIASLSAVVEKVPAYGRARLLLSLILSKVAEAQIRAGGFQEAIQACEQAIAVYPEHGHAHHFAGLARNRLREFDRALAHFRKAIELKSLRFWESYEPLAAALLALGRHGEALAVMEEGMAVRPRDDLMKAKLAWLLATAPDPKLRNGTRALGLAEEAVAAAEKPLAAYLDTLAAALAEVGRFPEAVRRAEEALVLAEARGEKELAQALRGRLEIYRQGRSLRAQVAPGG